MSQVISCGSYQCIASPVDWTAIDVLAFLTVIWIIVTFIYKGLRQYKVMRYPQIQMVIPYARWETALVKEKPPIRAGAAVKYFFVTLFKDVLAMGILKCEAGLTDAEVVRTGKAKRAAKLMIVWGFIFAAISTTLAYLTFPHNEIVLNLTNPARVFGMIGGVLMIVGSLLWLSVRYKEVNYRGWWHWLGAEYLPFLVLLIGISGFVLQAALLAYAASPDSTAAVAFLWFAVHLHAIPVALFFWAFFWTNADHIIYAFLWRIQEYADKEIAGAMTRLPPTNIPPLNKSGKEIQPGY